MTNMDCAGDAFTPPPDHSQITSENTMSNIQGQHYARVQQTTSWDLDERTHFNSLSPLCGNFPSELLAEVFAYLAVDEGPCSHRSYIMHNNLTHPNLGWIKVTHVCRHWRNVALDYPSLWGKITYALGPKWTALMIERAKSAPLSLKQKWGGQRAIAAGELEYIPEKIGQIEELTLYGVPFDLRRIVKRLEDKPAPRVREFSLDSIHRDNIPEHLMLRIEDGLFAGGNAPRLRRIHLNNCRLSWTSPLLQNLTTLEICQDKYA